MSQSPEEVVREILSRKWQIPVQKLYEYVMYGFKIWFVFRGADLDECCTVLEEQDRDVVLAFDWVLCHHQKVCSEWSISNENWEPGQTGYHLDFGFDSIRQLSAFLKHHEIDAELVDPTRELDNNRIFELVPLIEWLESRKNHED